MALSPVYVQLPLFPTDKVCTRCGVEKPLQDFRLNAHGRDGRAERCVACARAMQNERYRAKHPPPPREATERRCPQCGQIKPLEQFACSSMGRYGRTSRCKACRAIENRNRDVVHPERRLVVDEKVCTVCGLAKPIADFGVQRRRRDGYSERCDEFRAKLLRYNSTLQRA